MQNLLKEQVSIRDLLTVFETLADEAVKTKDLEVLTESVRVALARGITSKLTGHEDCVDVLNLSPNLEELMMNSLIQTEQGIQLAMDSQVAHDFVSQVVTSIEKNPEIAGQPILMTSPTLRRHVYKLLSRFIPQLTVLAHNELTNDVNVSSVGVVEMSNAS